MSKSKMIEMPVANLVPNGDFESGVTGWEASSGATITHNVDDWSWVGAGCLQVTTAGSGPLEGARVLFAGANDNHPVSAGQVYLAEAVVATEDTHVVMLRVGFDHGQTRVLGYAQAHDVARDCISGVFVVPPGCTVINTFALLTTATAAGDFYVDEVRLLQIATTS